MSRFHLASIVEGHGEVQALRVLVNKLFPDLQVSTPIRCTKGEIKELKPRFINHLKIAEANISENRIDGLILVLIDADDDCPAQLKNDVLPRVQKEVRYPSLVVVANRCYESWLVAGDHNFDGIDPDVVNSKAWIQQRQSGYNPRVHQAGYTSRLDIGLAARRSQSFAYLCDKLKNSLPAQRD